MLALTSGLEKIKWQSGHKHKMWQGEFQTRLVFQHKEYRLLLL